MPPSRRRRVPSGARDTQTRPATPPSRPPGAEEDASSAEDRDHYSYEEMVDHLRKVRSTAGDQGLKSKKKKRRRSHQPLREKRRRRFLLALALVLVIFPLGAFVAGSFLFSYLAYKGESFRKEISASVSQKLGVQGEFEDKFQVSRLRMKNRKFRAVGSDDAVLAAFELTNLEAKLRSSSYFSGEWRILQMIADRAMLHLRPLAPQTGETTALAPSLEEPLKILAAGLGFSGVPDSYSIQRLSCRDLSANFGANPDVVHRLEGLHVTMNRTKSGYFINCHRGKLKYLYWPEFTVDAADITLYPDGKLDIHRVSLITEEGGTCSLTGEINLGADPSINLMAEVANIKLDTIVNSTWKERVLGRLSGEFTIAGALTMDDLPKITGKIQIPGLSVKNLPILSALSDQCGIAELKRIEFDLFEARIQQEGNEIRVQDIYGSRPSLAGLTGEFTVHSNHELGGSFEIGLPEGTLESMSDGGLRKGRPSFFKSKPDGTHYGWAEFSVTGNLEHPIDNLDRQFETYYGGSGTYNPREYRRSAGFQRPQPLRRGPEEIYLERLNRLFASFVGESNID